MMDAENEILNASCNILVCIERRCVTARYFNDRATLINVYAKN